MFYCKIFGLIFLINPFVEKIDISIKFFSSIIAKKYLS